MSRDHQGAAGIRRAAARVVVAYLLFGAAWIFFSDRALAWIGYGSVVWLQTAKGWFYVLATGALLYGLVWRQLAKQARQEQRQRESQEALLRQLRLLADNTTDMIWTMGLDGRFTYVSPSVLELRGFTPEEVQQQTLAEAVCEGSLQPISQALAEALEKHAAGQREPTATLEVEQPRKDGTTVWTEVTARLIVDEQGQPSGVVGVSRDIDERRAAQLALRESEERFRLAAEAAGDLIYERDLRTGDAVFFSDIDTRQGFAPGEYPRSFAGWTQHIHPDDASGVIEEFGAASREHRKFEASYRLRRKDGEYNEWVDRAQFVYDASGAAARVVGAATDVTESRKAERENAALQDQLQQAMKMEAIGRLAGGVAHDFNNLLTAISGNVELARDELRPGDPVHESLDEIAKAARNAADLTRQLLAFSRKQVIAPTVLDLNKLIEGTRRLLSRLLGEDIDLKLQLGSQRLRVKADQSQLEQVLVNLAVNARDAMPKGGELRIATGLRTEAEGGANAAVVLSVTDCGVGMDDVVKAHVFEPFFTTKPRGKGTGLGLATTYGAVRQMGGAIEVDSELGKGTTFRIILPMVQDEQVAPARDTTANPASGGGETILLVEDEPHVRSLTARMLLRLGYCVIEAPDGHAALQKEERWPGRIHLLLTDVVMPGMTGRELAQRLCKRRSDVRVLFASGYAEDVITHRGALEDGIAFLPKPFSIEALASAVRGALRPADGGTNDRLDGSGGAK